MKKMKVSTIRKIITALMIIAMLASICMPVFAADDKDKAGDLMDPSKVSGTSTKAANSTSTFLNNVLGIVQIVAVSVAVIMLIILGVKYISAAPGEKADIKQGAMIYVVGAILMFAAAAIVGIIKGFAGTIK